MTWLSENSNSHTGKQSTTQRTQSKTKPTQKKISSQVE
jgi:hypothetical protein